MDSVEYTRWAAYEKATGPLGQERDDRLAAMIAERVTSMLTPKKADRRRIKIADFLPQWGGRQDKPAQSPEQQKTLLKALTSKLGGVFRGKEG